MIKSHLMAFLVGVRRGAVINAWVHVIMAAMVIFSVLVRG